MKIQRKEVREKRRLRVSFHEPGRPIHTAFTHDVSPSGVCVQSMRLMDPGRVIDLHVDTPLGFVSLRGVVTWTHRGTALLTHQSGNRFGVRLLAAGPKWKSWLSSDETRSPTSP